MQAIPADNSFLQQGAGFCVVVDNSEAPTSQEIINFANKHRAKTETGLYLVGFPLSEPSQTLLSHAQLGKIFTTT